jgi:hypothetical protein
MDRKETRLAELETVAFLTYEDRESHWYVIAFYNELFKINDTSAYLDQQLIPII